MLIQKRYKFEYSKSETCTLLQAAIAWLKSSEVTPTAEEQATAEGSRMPISPSFLLNRPLDVFVGAAATLLNQFIWATSCANLLHRSSYFFVTFVCFQAVHQKHCNSPVAMTPICDTALAKDIRLCAARICLMTLPSDASDLVGLGFGFGCRTLSAQHCFEMFWVWPELNSSCPWKLYI